MQIPSTKWRNLIFLIALVILGFTALHLRESSLTQPDVPHLHNTPIVEADDVFIPSADPSEPEPDLVPEEKPLELIIEEEPVATTPCDLVDFGWLASDRKYWDGWGSKAMFMEPSGNFTRKNVAATEGDVLCVVVMLGPTPAKSAIRPEEHLAPADSLVVTANGLENEFSIQVEQHQKYTNIYFAPVRFSHEDVYVLQTWIEYRSYFWETPAIHQYRPFRFLSANKLTVNGKGTPALVAADTASSRKQQLALPQCDPSNPDHYRGVWMNKTRYQELYPLDFYGMFGVSQEDHAVENKLFVPDMCQPSYIGIGQAAQCLDGKTVHVWADNNVRRNLKVFSSGNRWCNGNEASGSRAAAANKSATATACVCNDDDEDHAELYPWAVDPTVPLVINTTWNVDAQIYFNAITESIASRDWKKTIREATETSSMAPADVVIVGFGNEDVRLRTMSPMQFHKMFADLVQYLVDTVYPTQKIIVRTPQPFCCGTIYSTAWTQGRSEAFTKAVRDAYRWNDRVVLWDVHVLGMPSHMCVKEGSVYSTRKVVSVENLQLWNLVCPSS